MGHWHECTWSPLCSWWPPGLPINYCKTLRAYWLSCRMAMMGDGPLRCSFSISLKVLPDSPIYSSGQLMCGHLHLYMTQLFWSLLSLSLGAMRRVLMVLLSLKCTWIPKLLHVLLNLSPSLWIYGTTMEIFLLFDPLLCVLWLVASGCLSIMDVVFMVEFVL